MKAATGSAVGLALGLEQEFGVPGTGGLIAYRPILPLDGELIGEESASEQVNPGGFVERGVPGPKAGEIDFGHPLQAAQMLEFIQHFLRDGVKVELEAGPPAVYKYTLSPNNLLDPTSFWGLVDKAPVDRYWDYGIMFGDVAVEIGDNEEIPVRLTGAASHGTRMGKAVADVANTGTYTKGPHLRGVLKSAAAGKIHVRITSLAPLQFKVHQTAGAPAFPGAAVDVVYDAETLRAVWQNLQDQAGLDLGIWGENKDPLEIIFPGLAADHADLDVGDTWSFELPGVWPAPAVSALTGHQKFTSAHWEARTRAIGAGVWVTRPIRTGSFGLEYEIEADRGNTSRYAFGQLRGGALRPTVSLTRAFVNRVFAELQEKHDRFELQLAFLGRQLGTGAFRESIVATYGSVGIEEGSRPASEAGVVEEEVTLVGETNDAGADPISIEVITTRNWTPTP